MAESLPANFVTPLPAAGPGARAAPQEKAVYTRSLLCRMYPVPAVVL